MRNLTLLTLLLGCSLHAQEFTRAQYFKNQDKPLEGSLRFDTAKRNLLFTAKGGGEVFSAPFASIKGLTYERTARPRYLLGVLVSAQFLFTYEKKHFLTVQYGTADFAVLRLDKKNYQLVLGMAEAETGKKIEWRLEP